MRGTILKVAFMALCGATRLLAQAPHPHLAALPGETHSRGHSIAVQAAPQPAATSIFDATGLGSPLLLDQGWRVGITGNPAAAAPDFDDSSWAVRDAQGLMNEVPDVDQPSGPPDKGAHYGEDDRPGRRHRYAWFRLHIKLAPGHRPLALLVELPVSLNTAIPVGVKGPGVDVFINGKLALPEGPHGDTPEHYQQIARLYKIDPPSSDTSVTIALRTIYIPYGYGSYTTFFSGRTLLLGYRPDLEHELELWSHHSLFERLPRLVYSVLLLVLSMFLLALYFTQKGHIEYLWLALHELVQAPIGFVELAGSSALLDSLWYAALVLQLVLVSAYLFFEFLIAFLALPRRWYIKLLRYSSPVLAGVGPTLLMVGHGTGIGIMLALAIVGSSLWMLGWILFTFTTLIAAAVRRNFEAALLLVPLLLSIVGLVEPILDASMGDWSGHAYVSPLTIIAGPIPIHFASIADFTGIFVIVLIVFVRFLRVHRDQERASSELAAARNVQELMIPQEKLHTPGFEVDSVYNPANEVGGDFFHVEVIGEGGILVVIGDVAGKGLKAAMNVSMLMGALRRTPECGPANILESLNRVLVGSESFTTCQAAWFGANGELVLANAGHLPPYLNSQEIAIPGGLPLGVLPEIQYEEVRLYLHPGDRVLLFSDGVVEARGPSGELFGFDRVHNLSNQSAFYIADAAKTFGQDDDITVLTVRRMAQAIAA